METLRYLQQLCHRSHRIGQVVIRANPALQYFCPLKSYFPYTRKKLSAKDLPRIWPIIL